MKGKMLKIIRSEEVG